MQVDIGADTFDVYADTDFADLFLAGDVLRAAGWAIRNPEAKARGLVSATRMLRRMPWTVVPAPLPTDDPENAVVQEVTAMLAADLLAKPRLFSDAATTSNVKSVKAGSASVDFFSPVRDGPPMPRVLWDMLVAANLVGLLDGDDGSGPPFVTGNDRPCRPLGGRWQTDWLCAEQDYD